jgi:ubiquinone/menaquinone biosynthesis C-methylase UbiE
MSTSLRLALVSPQCAQSLDYKQPGMGGNPVKIRQGFVTLRLIFHKPLWVFFGRKIAEYVSSIGSTQSPRTEYFTLWTGDSYIGHILVFGPSRARIPFLFPRNVLEITYSIQDGFQRHGFGTYLISKIIAKNSLAGISTAAIIASDNIGSNRIIERFDPEYYPVTRTKGLLGSRYVVSGAQKSVSERDKLEEFDRYQLVSMEEDTREISIELGSSTIDKTLSSSTVFYEREIARNIAQGNSVLELGAGIGQNTLAVLQAGAVLTALDISPNALKLLKNRLAAAGYGVVTHVADIESLPFECDSFDVVTGAGCLSYGDNEKVLNEILRVLKPGGKFICIDSLNQNPIYRLNRYVHYLRGDRSMSTLLRMPSLKLLDQYRRRFDSVDIRYFGSVAYFCLLLKKLTGDAVALSFSDWVDRAVSVKGSAFKFVMVARKG